MNIDLIRLKLRTWHDQLPFSPKLIYIIAVMLALLVSLWFGIAIMILWYGFLAFIYWNEIKWMRELVLARAK